MPETLDYIGQLPEAKPQVSFEGLWFSEETDKLDDALAAAQGEFTNPEKNRHVTVRTKAGGEYGFDYATFDAILEMARPALAKHAVSVMQFPFVHRGESDVTVTVRTRIAHKGQWMMFQISGPVESWEMQKIGSGMTYLNRYSYSSALGIASEFDDDGGAASGNETTPSDRPARAELPPCPKCKTNSHVIIGKPEYGGGFVCFKKKGGCGETWQAGGPELAQEYGLGNPAPDDLPDAPKTPAKKPPAKKKDPGEVPMTAEEIADAERKKCYSTFATTITEASVKKETARLSKGLEKVKESFEAGKLNQDQAEALNRMIKRCLEEIEKENKAA